MLVATAIRNTPRKERKTKVVNCASFLLVFLLVFVLVAINFIGNDQGYELETTSSTVAFEKNKAKVVTEQESPSMGRALECLRRTKSELPDLSYPRDSFEHFHHIHHRLSRWIQHSDHKPHKAAGYSGPWIENHWISHFQQELESNHYSLSDVFGPYIPILIPWTDIWVKNRFQYPQDLIATMKDLLREDVMYITINQNDDGLVGRCTEFNDIQNKYHITVLSAGGYGHVPVPLLKQPEAPLPKIPLNERKHLVSYVGSKNNAPDNMREVTIAHMEKAGHYYFKGSEWRDIMAQSKFSLCPRGFGRTSYHVMETLQMGLIPIQVYLDQPWLPYANLMKNVSYTVTNDELPDLFLHLSKMPDSEVEELEARIGKLREDYFSFEGTMKQIGRFMLDPTNSELVCQALPSTPR
mmetsp:Transcript_26953/g.59228  ORF Transcript_26953/g.59228 Transcript_26953/m.59228 type:complete len:410 (+) Transcript_26953:149-1378(+)|eukprot:CAMPEP_0168179790 /NCGR_PEP_ID=MMETSP0139_2-20121125/10071_1 /TAXON_ID=44445 /ORGANISM="Pseudo-nitzschia australis, Strain 10249 10 AB" /LENGTH=409 /DNA_ID=CAMNT_0008099723 /DNA_START=137 /DNA_END=1366 /DNA_ORIENTATION=+